MNKTQISGRQLAILTFFLTLGSSLLLMPAIVASTAKQDAWLSMIVAFGIGLLLVTLYARIGQHGGSAGLEALVQRVFGRWLGGAVMVVLFFYLLLHTALSLRDLGIFMTVQLMTETPLEIVLLTFVLVCAVAVRLGLETFARAAEIVFPLFLFLFVVLLGVAVWNIDINNLRPVLHSGWNRILYGGIDVAHFPYFNLFSLVFIYDAVSDPVKAKKGLMKGMIVGGVLLSALTIVCVLVLGPEATARHLYPGYALSKTIYFGHFLQRVEIILALLWFMSIFFRVTILLYCSVTCAARWFKLTHHQSLVQTITVIVFAMSILVAPNTPSLMSAGVQFGIPLTMIFGVLLPLFIYSALILRKSNI